MIALSVQDKNDLVCILTQLLCSSAIACRLQNVLLVSVKFFPSLARAGLVAEELCHLYVVVYYGLRHVLARTILK